MMGVVGFREGKVPSIGCAEVGLMQEARLTDSDRLLSRGDL